MKAKRDESGNRIKEKDILKAVKEYLGFDYRVAWVMRVNSGALKITDHAGSRFLRFGEEGFSDLVGQLIDGRLLAIEVKKPNGKLTERQKLFLEKVKSNKGVSGMARSVEDAKAILDSAGLLEGIK